MTDKSLRGHWWRPNHDQDRQPGTLRITDTGELTLDLIGGFDLHIRRPLEEGGYAVMIGEHPLPILLGATEQGPVTLLDCSTARSSARQARWGGGAPDFHVLHADRALIGTHLAAEADAVFRQVQVRFENLIYFLDQSMPTMIAPDGGMPEAPATLTATVDGMHFEADQRTSQVRSEERDTLSIGVSTHSFISITPPAPVSCMAFDQLISAVMDLLTLASDQASGVISCTLVHQETRPLRPGTRHQEGVRCDIEVEMVARRVHTANPSSPPQKAREWLFTCGTMPYAELLPAWFRVHERAVAACNTLSAMKYVAPGFLETQALLTAVTAEALHRSLYGDQVTPPHPDAAAAAATELAAAMTEGQRRKITDRLNNPNFRNRLLNLAARLPAAVVGLFIPSVNAWAIELEKVRNGIAHEANHAGDLLDLYALTRQTSYLLFLSLMNEMGFDEPALRAAIEHKTLSWRM